MGKTMTLVEQLNRLVDDLESKLAYRKVTDVEVKILIGCIREILGREPEALEVELGEIVQKLTEEEDMYDDYGEVEYDPISFPPEDFEYQDDGAYSSEEEEAPLYDPYESEIRTSGKEASYKAPEQSDVPEYSELHDYDDVCKQEDIAGWWLKRAEMKAKMKRLKEQQ